MNLNQRAKVEGIEMGKMRRTDSFSQPWKEMVSLTRSEEEMPKYTKEFKAKAVQLSALDGVTIKDAAESLDIHPVTLAKGIKRRKDRGG